MPTHVQCQYKYNCNARTTPAPTKVQYQWLLCKDTKAQSTRRQFGMMRRYFKTGMFFEPAILAFSKQYSERLDWHMFTARDQRQHHQNGLALTNSSKFKFIILKRLPEQSRQRLILKMGVAHLTDMLLQLAEVCSSNPATCPFWTNHILEILLNGSNKTMQGSDYWKVSLQVVCLEKAEVGKSEDFLATTNFYFC